MTEYKRLATREPVFDSGYLRDKTCYYNGSTKAHVAGLHCAFKHTLYSGSLDPASLILKATEITLGDRYIELGNRAVGILVDAREHKSFIIRRDTEDDYPGRLRIRCYDQNGNILDGSTNDYCTYGLWSTTYGGTYGPSSDHGGDIFLGVTDDVDFVAVLLAGGTNPCRLRRFWVYATDGVMGRGFSWPGYEVGIPNANLATTPPTAGTWIEMRDLTGN